MVEALSGKVFLIVTGASRGIGKQIAIKFGSMIHEDSHVLLLATNLNALKDTAKQIPVKAVDTISIDLSKAQKDELEGVIKDSLKKKTPADFDRLVVVHNVGSMGDTTKRTVDMVDMEMWHNYYDLNLFVPAILNAVVMNAFQSMPDSKKTVINISSLLGIKPSRMMGAYSSVKAAKDMYFKVFALEHPEVNVLNYSPGPVDTDMFHKVCDQTTDKELKAQFVELRDKKTVLTCEQTINRLTTVLKEHKYTSGDHVDYYDEL